MFNKFVPRDIVSFVNEYSDCKFRISISEDYGNDIPHYSFSLIAFGQGAKEWMGELPCHMFEGLGINESHMYIDDAIKNINKFFIAFNRWYNNG